MNRRLLLPFLVFFICIHAYAENVNHTNGIVYAPGDVNHDGTVDISDVLTTVDYVLKKGNSSFFFSNADLNNDGTIDISDILAIVDLILGRRSDNLLNVEYTYPNIRISSGSNYVCGSMDRTIGSPYEGNPVFNFTNWFFQNQQGNAGDDVAPIHVQNTTIGANHGQPCYSATVESHGLDNYSIGTEWTDVNGTKFYVMRVPDPNHLIFLSENKGTDQNHSFVKLNTGNLKRNDRLLRVTDVTVTQLRPSVMNVSHTVLKDGQTPMSADAGFSCTFVDVVEEYDIVNTAQVLQNIIGRAGSLSDPTYQSSPMIHVKNIYRFSDNLACVVESSVEAKQSCVLSDIMFNQAGKISTGQVSYYVPGSKATSNYDFTKPCNVTWSTSIPSLYMNSSTWENLEHPVNRVIQIGQNAGLAIGFLPVGVGENLSDFTKSTFEMRNETGKVYPHGVESSVVGSIWHEGQKYSGVLYRCYFRSTQPTGRIAMYHFNYKGTEYVFSDYSQAINDKIVLGPSYFGKEIKVVESNNASLLSDKYNDGIYIKSTPVNGSTSYVVLKIK